MQVWRFRIATRHHRIDTVIRAVSVPDPGNPENPEKVSARFGFFRSFPVLLKVSESLACSGIIVRFHRIESLYLR